jgi:hypothetical protein
MRASPPCRVSLRHFGAWRAAVVLLTCAGAVAIASWLPSREPVVSVGWAMTLVVAAALLMLACAVSLWRVPAQSLRWDGRVWQLDGVPGELKAAIDLGPWMLLNFTPEMSGGTSWLPIQRRGLETQWHALRCAVYSPRPAAEA